MSIQLTLYSFKNKPLILKNVIHYNYGSIGGVVSVLHVTQKVCWFWTTKEKTTTYSLFDFTSIVEG